MRKNKLSFLIALLLTALLLTGCGLDSLPGAYERSEYAYKDICRFDDMEYVRPDMQDIRMSARAIEKALENGAGLKAVESLLNDFNELSYNFDTMYTIANIRSCQDFTDAYYAAEYDWCSNAYYDLQQLTDELFRACSASELGNRLEEDYFWEGFLDEYSPEEESIYTDEYMSLVYRENELLSQYRSLLSDNSIELDGEEWDIGDYLSRTDDEGSGRAYSAYYEKYNPLIGEVYVQLVKLRNEQAGTLGYDSYARMQYELSYERGYRVEDGREYIEAIKKYIVPAYKILMAGNPYSSLVYDYLPENELMTHVQTAAETMGGDVEEAFSFMREYELYDVALRENKVNNSFQTYLASYEAPFMFVSPYGDTEDLISVLHEFGHYTDAYVNFNAYETMDLAECYSQTMQYLGLCSLRDSLTQSEYENLMRMNNISTLETFVQQASFAEFEDRVYEADADELTVEWINALSLELAMEYGYYDGVSDDYYALSWIDTPHFFEAPFYVISYPVSASVALEVYALELETPGAGLDKYREMLRRDYSGLTDMVSAVSLADPLDAGQVQKAARLLTDGI